MIRLNVQLALAAELRGCLVEFNRLSEKLDANDKVSHGLWFALMADIDALTAQLDALDGGDYVSH